MPMEQEKVRGPVLVGVNSMMVSPDSGRIFSIPSLGMVKAREQD